MLEARDEGATMLGIQKNRSCPVKHGRNLCTRSTYQIFFWTCIDFTERQTAPGATRRRDKLNAIKARRTQSAGIRDLGSALHTARREHRINDETRYVLKRGRHEYALYLRHFRHGGILCHKQGMSGPPRIFDRSTVARNRNRSAASSLPVPPFVVEARDRLLDRLNDVTRTFTTALVLGGRDGETAHALKTKFGVTECISTDLSGVQSAKARQMGRTSVNADEEWIPFGDNSFDLIVAELCLHWTNDLPGSLIQLRRTLKPDGLFLANVFGGQTLHELRSSWTEAESELLGGVTPRVSPFLDVRDAGDLLVRAGFALPVTDSDIITVDFDTVQSLAHTLRSMGETNAIVSRTRTPTIRRLWNLMDASYRSRYANQTGGVNATFEVVSLTAWAPDPRQQKPLAPGSASARLADALGGTETPV
jgi:NADH dehydrogenase [ubiquinone] 1 alpha subcomplex assembly factor 5